MRNLIQEIPLLLQEPSIKILMDPLKLYDIEIYQHSINVAYITALMLEYADIGAGTYQKCIEIVKGALLHDIGKIVIPLSILNSSSKLTKTEFNQMKYHPIASEVYAENNKFSSIVGYICKMHHEKLNGTGYPDGISCIPFFVQIVTVSDIFDALISERSYKKALSCDDALKQLKREMRDGKLNSEAICLVEAVYKDHRQIHSFPERIAT